MLTFCFTETFSPWYSSTWNWWRQQRCRRRRNKCFTIHFFLKWFFLQHFAYNLRTTQIKRDTFEFFSFRSQPLRRSLRYNNVFVFVKFIGRRVRFVPLNWSSYVVIVAVQIISDSFFTSRHLTKSRICFFNYNFEKEDEKKKKIMKLLNYVNQRFQTQNQSHEKTLFYDNIKQT